MFEKLLSNNYYLLTRRGFSLIEVMLSIAIVTIIFGLGVFSFISINNINDLGISISYFKNSLFQAKVRSLASENDSGWSVHVATGTVTVFKGDDYGNRDNSFDNIFEISERISITGQNDYSFSKREGILVSVATTTFSFESNSRDVGVNTLGTTYEAF